VSPHSKLLAVALFAAPLLAGCGQGQAMRGVGVLVEAQLVAGKSADEIVAHWEPALTEFRARRSAHLPYD